mmetsp:Transcript_17451/g.35234  ORF Transcript_17451/g.35234 Transcript_17451/m.35234 type:complete len:128 (+) Transcript_17451:18-401(+)
MKQWIISKTPTSSLSSLINSKLCNKRNELPTNVKQTISSYLTANPNDASASTRIVTDNMMKQPPLSHPKTVESCVSGATISSTPAKSNARMFALQLPTSTDSSARIPCKPWKHCEAEGPFNYASSHV